MNVEIEAILPEITIRFLIASGKIYLPQYSGGLSAQQNSKLESADCQGLELSRTQLIPQAVLAK